MAVGIFVPLTFSDTSTSVLVDFVALWEAIFNPFKIGGLL